MPSRTLPAGTKERPGSRRPRDEARSCREACEARDEAGEQEVDSNFNREEMLAAEAGMERYVESVEEVTMEEMRVLLRRSMWLEVGRIHPSSDTRWILLVKEEVEKKEEESRAECSDGSWDSRNVIPASLFKTDCGLEQMQAGAFFSGPK